jgi:hypothetical protein
MFCGNFHTIALVLLDLEGWVDIYATEEEMNWKEAQ